MTAMTLIAAGIVVGALMGLAVRRWMVASARVVSSSMEPTLRPGQRLVVRRLRTAGRVARGDLVLVRSAEVGRVVVKRAIGLPEGVDLAAAKAEFKNGVLTVTIPKTAEAQKSVKHIAVQRH